MRKGQSRPEEDRVVWRGGGRGEGGGEGGERGGRGKGEGRGKAGIRGGGGSGTISHVVYIAECSNGFLFSGGGRKRLEIWRGGRKKRRQEGEREKGRNKGREREEREVEIT